MFLTTDNKLKWKWIAVAAAVTIALCLGGIFWFDKPLYLFMRRFDWSGWGVLAGLSSKSFWLVTSFAFGVGFFVGKKLVSKKAQKSSGKKFNFKNMIAASIAEIKSNPGFLVFLSVATAMIAAGILKLGIGRARPLFFEALGQTGFYPLTADWAFNSMPSGHTTASFAALVMVGLMFPKIKWATWTTAIVIGAARVCCGAHWPTDVILGAFIGMVCADIIKSAIKIDN